MICNLSFSSNNLCTLKTCYTFWNIRILLFNMTVFWHFKIFLIHSFCCCFSFLAYESIAVLSIPITNERLDIMKYTEPKETLKIFENKKYSLKMPTSEFVVYPEWDFSLSLTFPLADLERAFEVLWDVVKRNKKWLEPG